MEDEKRGRVSACDVREFYVTKGQTDVEWIQDIAYVNTHPINSDQLLMTMPQ